ncbi:MAG TPA: DNA mismatch repair endonuclease MutL, partial [Chloroflexota bacterium]|nr:DNA mismatch repair endonuclease MutL [Chloroflexota bacterium]
MSHIRVMDPHLAAKIAAGEVIERPASVVKELVENALDAGARHVQVEIEGGGADRILVADDGHGIAADEVELAFRRHATSKLHTESDLNALRTLGFRGEALPSIAAVADVICSTRSGREAIGVELRIEGGAFEQQPLARQPGTTMVVEALFARFPARRKFLRGRGSEAAACLQVLQSLALAFPDVQLTALVDGREALRTPGTGAMRDAAVAVLGADAADYLIDLPSTTLEGE